jgi:hypothetical protein
MLKENPEIAVDLTEEEAFYVTGTASREELERELSRLRRLDIICYWMAPSKVGDTYFLIWGPMPAGND